MNSVCKNGLIQTCIKSFPLSDRIWILSETRHNVLFRRIVIRTWYFLPLDISCKRFYNLPANPEKFVRRYFFGDFFYFFLNFLLFRPYPKINSIKKELCFNSIGINKPKKNVSVSIKGKIFFSKGEGLQLI